MEKRYILKRQGFIMEKDLKKFFGEAMRKERIKRQLTQKELAELIGVSTVYWRDLERGKYTATWIIWLKICTVLGLDTDIMRDTYVSAEVNEIAEIMGKKL